MRLFLILINVDLADLYSSVNQPFSNWPTNVLKVMHGRMAHSRYEIEEYFKAHEGNKSKTNSFDFPSWQSVKQNIDAEQFTNDTVTLKV